MIMEKEILLHKSEIKSLLKEAEMNKHNCALRPIKAICKDTERVFILGD